MFPEEEKVLGYKFSKKIILLNYLLLLVDQINNQS
jgi:hypothetical protein